MKYCLYVNNLSYMHGDRAYICGHVWWTEHSQNLYDRKLHAESEHYMTWLMVRSVIGVYTKTRNGHGQPNFLTQLILYSSALLTAISRCAKQRFPAILAIDKTFSTSVHVTWWNCSYLQNVRQNSIKRYAKCGLAPNILRHWTESRYHLQATTSLLPVKDKRYLPAAMYSEHRRWCRRDGEFNVLFTVYHSEVIT
jgi:hypothetical protein